MLSQPQFGSGVLTDGTYPCVMIEMSDWVKFTPDGNIGAQCTNGTEYTLDVCGGSDTYLKIDGTTGTCSGTNGSTGGGRVESKVVMYLSTNSTSTNGADAFNPPTSGNDASNGFNLPSALIVAGSEVGLFDVNGTGKVDGDSNAYCELSPPLFSFSKR